MKKETKKAPTIRFRGFTDDWEQRKVGEFYDFKNGLNKNKEFFGKGVPIVNFTDVFHNRGLTASQLEGKVTLEPNEIKNYSVEKGDIFFTRTSETIEEIGYPSVMLDTPENTVFSGFVLRGRCFSGNDPLDNLFKQYVFFTQSFRDEMKKKSSMTTRALTSGTSIKEMLFHFPSSKNEQHQIGKYITKFDNIITLHQRKLDQLKTLKKYFLQNMFPAKGEKVPRIRFKGFTGDWKQHKLGECCDMYNGDRSAKYPNAKDMVSEGIPFINAGDLIDGHVNLSTANKITREKYHNLGGAKLQVGDIVYCLRGTLGKNAYIDNFAEGTVASSLVAIRPKNINGRYLFEVLNSDIEYRQRRLRDEGAAQPNLSAKNVSEFIIPVPNYEEQLRISQYLDKLDTLITLHRQKLGKLQTMKKFMLQNMFI